MQSLKYSVVLPVYNEKDNLAQLFDELTAVMRQLTEPFEIICIDDGSSDESCDIINNYQSLHKEIELLRFVKNQGQSAALAAGFKASRGEYVITLDADLQNNPADILLLLEHIPRYDMVTGWRTKRHDTLVTRLSSKIANWIRNKLSREDIHDTGCSLKIMKRTYLKNIKMFKGMHRFLPTLMKMEGANVIEVPVSHRPRIAGISNYGVWDRAFSGLRDLLAVRWMQDRFIHYEIIEEDK